MLIMMMMTMKEQWAHRCIDTLCYQCRGKHAFDLGLTLADADYT